MTPEILRRAATEIRNDYEGESSGVQSDFMLAVADWLDHTADLYDSSIEMFVTFGKKPPAAEDCYPWAFGVAREHLGDFS